MEEQDFVVNLDTADLRAWDQMHNGNLYKDMIMYPREVRACVLLLLYLHVCACALVCALK